MNNFVYVLGNSPTAKVLNMLIRDKDYDYYISDIARLSKVHRNTVYKILNDLKNYDIVTVTRKLGKSELYKLRLGTERVSRLIDLHITLTRKK